MLPPEDEYAATAALREAFPDQKLRFDPNALWSVETAVRLGARKVTLVYRRTEKEMVGREEERQHGLSHGAFSYLVKPATTGDLETALDRLKTYVAPHTKRLLVIEDDDRERASIVELLEHEDIEVTAVGAMDPAGVEKLRELGVSRVVIPPLARDKDSIRGALEDFANDVMAKVS